MGFYMNRIIQLDYNIKSYPRYGYGKSPHKKLNEFIAKNRALYSEILSDFLAYRDFFRDIPAELSETDSNPRWINDWISGLDCIALCGFLCKHNPHRYIEIGSGESTRFARWAINTFGLRTKITSIDPFPRLEIDSICDCVIREPVENLDPNFFCEMEPGDILFVDGSHRVFMNSDTSVIFLDVLPYLKNNILIHFHDIFLPHDYPLSWVDRYYSEQYLLAAYILAEGNKIQIILPNFFVCTDSELADILHPIWDGMSYITSHGASFWIKTSNR